MRVRRVTRDMVRALKRLEVVEYQLPDNRACDTARQQVYHVKRGDGGEYTTHVDYEKKVIRILRIA